jgi:hypothetical protein
MWLLRTLVNKNITRLGCAWITYNCETTRHNELNEQQIDIKYLTYKNLNLKKKTNK